MNSTEEQLRSQLERSEGENSALRAKLAIAEGRAIPMTAPTQQEIAALIKAADSNCADPYELIGKMADALEALAAERKWKPTATAPKDHLIDILIDGKERWCDCYYDQITDQWRTSRPGGRLVWVPARAVTHWREFQAPPQEDKQEAAS